MPKIPKPPELRQRRNRTSTAAILSTEGPKRKMPSLPSLGEDKQWHPQTVRWWRNLWRSPMAAEFLESDVDGLFRLAVLVDQYWKEPDVKLAAEIRMQEARFGLSPIDRRRLQWEVQRVEAGESKRKPAAMPVPSGDDPRRVLQVVQ